MKTYAKCNRDVYAPVTFNVIIPAGEWFEVHRECIQCRPSGRQLMLFTKDGIAVKARYCEVVQVFEK